jgi:TRAP-type C4-dicarboxylate transport system permease small subunit
LPNILVSIARGINKATEYLSNVAMVIGSTTIVVMIGIVVLGVFLRYVVHFPLVFSDEYAGYLFVIMSFMGLIYTLRQRGHIKVDVIIERLPTRMARWLELFTLVVALIYVSVIIVPITRYVIKSFNKGLTSITIMETPLAPIQSVLVIGLGLLILGLVVEIVKTCTEIYLERKNKE